MEEHSKNTKTLVPRPDPKEGGLLPEAIMRAVISVKTGIPQEHVGLDVIGDGVTWWDKRLGGAR